MVVNVISKNIFVTLLPLVSVLKSLPKSIFSHNATVK